MIFFILWNTKQEILDKGSTVFCLKLRKKKNTLVPIYFNCMNKTAGFWVVKLQS